MMATVGHEEAAALFCHCANNFIKKKMSLDCFGSSTKLYLPPPLLPFMSPPLSFDEVEKREDVSISSELEAAPCSPLLVSCSGTFVCGKRCR